MELATASDKLGFTARSRSKAGNARASKLKTWAFRLFAICFGFSVALIAAEIGVRLAGWPSPGLYVDGRGPIQIREPGRNGGAYPPDVRGELRHYDYSVEWNVNSFGFRDAEVGPKQPGEWRIAFLGDSFTAGIGVPQQDRFADVFAGEIKKMRPNVTVWNISAPLCGTACEAEMLNTANQRYQIDEVILAFYGGNDLEDNHAWFVNATKPVRNEPAITRSSREWLRDHSRLASFVWITGMRAWATFRPPGIFNQPELDRFWPDTERAFQLLRNAVGARRLTILYLPSLPEWNDSVWQVMRSRYGVALDARHLVRDAVAQWSQREGIGFVDATDWMHQCVPDSDCVFPVDTHWRANGHQLVAQALLRSARWTTSQ